MKNILSKASNPKLLRVLTTAFFWLNLNHIIFSILLIKRFFFFKFRRPKPVRRAVETRVWSNRRRKNIFITKTPDVKIKHRATRWLKISWKPRSVGAIKLRMRKVRKWSRYSKFPKWAAKHFVKWRPYKFKPRFFHWFLRQKIEDAQRLAGGLMFGHCEHRALKQLFKLFKGVYNNRIVMTGLLDRFYSVTRYFHYSNKYKQLTCLTQMYQFDDWKLYHCNMVTDFFFTKLLKKRVKWLKFFRVMHHRNRVYWRKRKLRYHTKYRRWRRKIVFPRRRRFNYPLHVKWSIVHHDRMTAIHFHDLKHRSMFYYYMNFILNIWNIRSYNWKQIT